MGSKSSKDQTSNSYSQVYSSNSQYPRIYPHVEPDNNQQYIPIYEHRATTNPSYVTALPNRFNSQPVQNVAHVQGEYRAHQHTYQQSNVVLHSPTAPPLSLIAQSNRGGTHKKVSSEDESKLTEKFISIDRFLKNILATVPEHYARKGYYCEACDGAYMRMTGEARRSHNSSQSHRQKKTESMIERYCPICRIDLFCTDLLWKRHEESKIHKFWREKSEKSCGAVQERKENDFKGKKAYLVVTGFPARTGWKSLKIFFEDFGKCARVEMGKDKGLEFARVFFNMRLVALNLHEIGFPLIFENRRLSTRVEWMV